MRNQWTRKLIIKEILARELDGLPLSIGGDQGISQALYQAGTRIFGSWRNAIAAAGIAHHRVCPYEKWTPGTILNTIRQLAKRKRPLTFTQLKSRHRALMAAARRTYGSWSKAVTVAGVDPAKFLRAVPWSRERIVEGILTRALNNEPLGPRTARPRSLAAAAEREFGSWAAAMRAAGLDPNGSGQRPSASDDDDAECAALPGHMTTGDDIEHPDPRLRMPHRYGERWTDELVLASIGARLQQRKRVNAKTVYWDDRGLFRAATRRFGNWANALLAAGLDPEKYSVVIRPRPTGETAHLNPVLDSGATGDHTKPRNEPDAMGEATPNAIKNDGGLRTVIES